jgi:hypothetical protein
VGILDTAAFAQHRIVFTLFFRVIHRDAAPLPDSLQDCSVVRVNVCGGSGVSYTATDLEKKVAFYQIRAAQAATKLDKQYWLRIATYWRGLQRHGHEDFDDQAN